MAQVVFMHDTAHVDSPPESIPELLAWAKANPGRFAYPQPPNFHGTTFLKQALIELVPDATVLLAPAANVDAVTAPLWAYLDELHPVLVADGARSFPRTGRR